MNKRKNNIKRNVILLNSGTDSNSFKQNVRGKIKYPPFGLLSLEAFLKSHGYGVKVIDLYSRYTTQKDFIDELRCFDEPPIAVGLSTYTENFELCAGLIRIIKNEFPDTKIIMGGPHVSFLPEEAIGLGADFVVGFEGESSFITLLEHIKYPQFLSPASIEGISYLKSGNVFTTGKRGFIKNLDHLPVIFNTYSFDENIPALYLITSRGCPGSCLFCASGSYSGKRYRANSAEWIFSAVYYHYSKYGITYIKIVDDTFTINLKRLRKIFTYLKAAGLKIQWEARCRIDQLSEQFVCMLKENGCVSLHLGVESAEQNVLDSINKNYKLETFYNNFKYLISYGIQPRCSFIIGNHMDTLEAIEKTLLLAYKIQAHKLGISAIGISTPLPGTDLMNKREELGIHLKTMRWRNYTFTKPLYYTDNFSLDDIRKAHYLFHNDAAKLEEEMILSGSPQKEFRAYLNNWINELVEIKQSRITPEPAAVPHSGM